MSENYMNTKCLELFRYQAGTTVNLSQGYWLSSRCAYYDTLSPSDFRYMIFNVSNGVVKASQLYVSSSRNDSDSYAIRPVVEIDLSKVRIGATGDGSSDSPYSITAR